MFSNRISKVALGAAMFMQLPVLAAIVCLVPQYIAICIVMLCFWPSGFACSIGGVILYDTLFCTQAKGDER